MTNLYEEIEKELMEAEEKKIQDEFKPKPISTAQVKGAKWAWILVVLGIDAATFYALYIILQPYWQYPAMWVISGAGGLLFSEWLWERVGNNAQQFEIADTSKKVSAIAVLIMAALSGVALILGIQRETWVEIVALLSSVGLVCFHGWQAYQYHEKDDDYIAKTEEARANAENLKDIRNIHRAGMKIQAKERVHITGAKYQKKYGGAFVQAAGRSYAHEEKSFLDDSKHPEPPKANP